MPENEFERDMQQKMEGLSFSPSEKVWDTVSTAIQQQKKNRKKIFLVILFLIFLLTGTVFLSDTQTKHFFSRQAITNNNPLKNDKPGTVKTSENSVQTPEVNANRHLQNITASTPHDSSTAIAVNAVGNVNHTASTQSSAIAHQAFPVAKKTKKITGKTTAQFSAGSIEETVSGTLPANEIQRAPALEDGIEQKAQQSIIKNIDTAAKIAAVKQPADTVINKTAGLAKTSTKIKKGSKNKWGFGISFAVGKSVTNNGYFNLSNASNYSLVPAGNNNNGGVNYTYLPSAIHSGVAFAAGFFASYPVTVKSNINFGFNYTFFSTHLLVSPDSSANNLTNINYGVGNIITYHNNFHFIEIPVTFQTSVAKIYKHPLYLETGLAVSQLFSTSALQFNAAQGRYYIGNNLFNKTIIGITAGLSINILNNKNAPLLVGPQISYSITPLANSGFYAKTHYSFAGIRIQKMLRKN